MNKIELGARYDLLSLFARRIDEAEDPRPPTVNRRDCWIVPVESLKVPGAAPPVSGALGGGHRTRRENRPPSSTEESAPVAFMVKRLGLVLLTLLLPLAAEAFWTDTVIVPGHSVGAIRATTTRADLVRLLGAGNVKDARIGVVEDESAAGTIVFPADPKRRLEITWGGSKTVEMVFIRGENAVWHTADGIGIGTSVSRLEKLNGKPFKFSGLGWDYGGNILDWQGGRLAHLRNEMMLTISTIPPGATSADQDAITGERDLFSNLPAVRRIDPRVSQLIVLLKH